MRTVNQRLLEAEHCKKIFEIITSALEAHRGQPSLVLRASMDLGVTGTTLYNWCNALGITVSDYRWTGPVEQEVEPRAPADARQRVPSDEQ